MKINWSDLEYLLIFSSVVFFFLFVIEKDFSIVAYGLPMDSLACFVAGIIIAIVLFFRKRPKPEPLKYEHP